MSDHPIIFSAPMVRAILDGRKTQTRRVVKPLGKRHPIENLAERGLDRDRTEYSGRHDDPLSWGYPGAEDGADMAIGAWIDLCPYGKTGDRLWVREGFMVAWPGGGDGLWTVIPYSGRLNSERRVFYRADGEDAPGEPQRCWSSPIHMPRWASRITLAITEVRVERLRAINEEDAIAEGCQRVEDDDASNIPDCPQCCGTGLYTAFDPISLGALPDTDCNMCDTPTKRYRLLWESINGAGSWDANPWVWALTFKRGQEH